MQSSTSKDKNKTHQLDRNFDFSLVVSIHFGKLSVVLNRVKSYDVQLQQFSISKKLGIMREKRHGEHAEK
jgi:type II restriction/modification system DNA methylase subunit YeeA